MRLVKKNDRVIGVVKDYGAEVVFAVYESHAMIITFDYSFAIIFLLFFPLRLKGSRIPVNRYS